MALLAASGVCATGSAAGAGLAAAGRSGNGESGLRRSSPSTTTLARVNAAGARYRYTWTARNHSAFTAGDIAQLASGFDTVIIEKTYDRSSFAAADEAARQIASAGRHPRVFANFLTRFVTPGFLNQFGPGFREEWFLHDASGQRIRVQRNNGWYVDLANSDYRRFIEEQVAARLHRAPYAGVIFDNFHVVGDSDRAGSAAQAAGIDAALPKLVTETKALVGSKLVWVNGVARGQSASSTKPDRGFVASAPADGVQDEFFCYLDERNAFRPASDTWADILTYRRLELSGKTVIHSVKLRTGDARSHAAQIKRFCFAAYLMDYVPGRALIQFKAYGNEDDGPQIEETPSAEQALDLGLPTTAPAAGRVWNRRFQRGWVAANAGATSASVTIPLGGHVRSGTGAGRRVVRGARLVVAPHDALYVTSS